MELMIRIDKDNNAHRHMHTIKEALSKVLFNVNLRFTFSIDEGKYQYMVIKVEGQHAKSMHAQISALDNIYAFLHMYICIHQVTIEVFDTVTSDWIEYSV